MNTEELNQKIANMEDELASMKALVNKPKPVINYWQPDVSKNERYYHVNYLGGVRFHFANDTSIKRYRVFKTEDEAEKYAKYTKAEETLRKAIAEANNGWLPNWTSSLEVKYLIVLDNSSLKVYSYGQIKHLPNYIYLNSSKKAKDIINTYEKELRTYLSY